MATLIIRNFPDDLHARLKEQASRHDRSVAEEALYLIEYGLGTRRQPPKLSPPLKLAGGYRPDIGDIESTIARGRDSK